jgi:hypothetical protein
MWEISKLIHNEMNSILSVKIFFIYLVKKKMKEKKSILLRANNVSYIAKIN